MTATMTAAKTITFRASCGQDTVTIKNVSGEKSLTLNIPRVRSAKLTPDQRSIAVAVCGLMAGEEIALTRPQMELLVAVREASSVALDTAKATVIDTAAGLDRRTKGSYRSTGDADVAEARINRAEAVINEVLADKVSMMIYDIPETLNKQCPNPSALLWRYGFRLNKSCWVMPQKSLDSAEVQSLLSHWQSYKIECHVIPYSEEAMGQIRDIARNKLSEEITRVHTALITRIGNASERYEELRRNLMGDHATAKAYEDAERAKDNAVRAILKTSAEALDGACACAERFDETMHVSHLIAGLRAAIRAEVATFNEGARVKGAKASTVRV